MSGLEARIGKLELLLLTSPDEGDVKALARRRRQEAVELERWYKQVRDYARSIGEDPDEYLEETRRRHLEERLGPPRARLKLVAGRLHELEPGETVEPGTKTFLLYG